mmetsp:Transcript_4749/g.10443  ORF Transcript_4749/g.10443 Transcript_4749/m.10443 type:complete len:528 (+) Transcript_4749:141-1724(+)
MSHDISILLHIDFIVAAGSQKRTSLAGGKTRKSVTTAGMGYPGTKSGPGLKGLVKSGWSSMRRIKKSPKKNRSSNFADDASIISAQSTAAVSIAIDEDAKTNKSFSSLSSSNTLASLVDEGAAATTTTIANSAAPKVMTRPVLDLVVLLMDSISHRFELLQLEFEDRSTAKVSDLLVQIPLSITEPSLKKLIYDGILDENYYRASAEILGGMSILPSSILYETFGNGGTSGSTDGSTKMVLVAKPEGVSNAECLRLAKPILSNRDVSKMLGLSGFDVSGWKSKKFPSRAAKKVNAENTKKTIPKTLNEKETGNYGKVIQNKSRPWLNTRREPENAGTFQKESAPVNSSNFPTLFVMLGLLCTLIIAKLLQSVMVKPILPGVLLKPGTYKTKCGMFGYVSLFAPGWKQTAKIFLDSIDKNVAPEFLSCQDEFLRVNYDGTVTLYDSNRQVSMILRGDLCTNNRSKNDEKSSSACIDGLMMTRNDKTLRMGGKPIKQVAARKSHRNKKLFPWPLEEEPAKLRYKVGKLN